MSLDGSSISNGSSTASPTRKGSIDVTDDAWSTLSNTGFTTAHPQFARSFFVRRCGDLNEPLQPNFDQISFLPYLAVPMTVVREEEAPTVYMSSLKRKIMKTKNKYGRPSSLLGGSSIDNSDSSPPPSPTTSSPLSASAQPQTRRELLRSLGGENLSMHSDLKSKGTRQAAVLASSLQTSSLATSVPGSTLPLERTGSSIRMKINVSSTEHHSVRVSDSDTVGWVLNQMPPRLLGQMTSPTLWLCVTWHSSPFCVVCPLAATSTLFTSINRVVKSPPTCFSSFSASLPPSSSSSSSSSSSRSPAAAAAKSLDRRPASKSAAPARSAPLRPQFPRSSSAHSGTQHHRNSTGSSSSSSSGSGSDSSSGGAAGTSQAAVAHSFQLYLLEAPGVHSSLSMQLSTFGFLVEHVLSKERVPLDDAIQERLKTSEGIRELMSREILLVALIQATTGLTRPLPSMSSHHSLRRKKYESGAATALAQLLDRLVSSYPLRTYLSTDTLLTGHVPTMLSFIWDLLYLYVTKQSSGTELETFHLLLQWCVQSTDQVPITDFKNSFSSGLAVAALLSSFNSTLFPATQWSACDPFTAVTESLELFHTRLGVPPILEPAHWTPPSNIDSAAIALYLYFVRARLLPLQQRVASCNECDANGLRYLRIRFEGFEPYKLKTLKNLHPATTAADVKRLLARDHYPALNYPRISTESFDLCIFKQGQRCMLPDLDVIDLNIKEVVAARRSVATRRELLLSRSGALVKSKQQEQIPEENHASTPAAYQSPPELEHSLPPTELDSSSLSASAHLEDTPTLPSAESSNSITELSSERPSPPAPRSRSPRPGGSEKRKSGFLSGFHRI